MNDRDPRPMCEHYACRCALAEEMAKIADRLDSVRYVVEAVNVHFSRVPCRIEPTRSPARSTSHAA